MPRRRSSRSDVEAVHARQHHVEQDEIEPLGRGAFERALTVAAGLDRVAFARQAVGQGEDEARFVLDEQEPFHV